MRHDDCDERRQSSSRLRRALRPLALLGSVGLALWGQHLLTEPERGRAGALSYAFTVALFLWGLGAASETEPWPVRGEGSRPPESSPTGTRTEMLERAGIGLIALTLSRAAYSRLFDNRFSASGVAAWLGAIAAFLCAAAEGISPSKLIRHFRRRLRTVLGAARNQPLRRRLDWTAFLLVLVIATGIFFRVYRLPGVAAEMTSDHAEKLLDVHDVLRGARPIFFPRNTGREPLQFYLTAALIHLTPLTISHLALKVGTALVSIITIPLAFLLGRVIYGRRVGLLTAGFVAVSRWHVVISRVGLRFPFTPLFTALTLAFLFRAFRDNRRADWVICGLALGLGQHTYTAVLILPLLLVVLTLAKAGWDFTDRWRRVDGMSPAASGSYSESSALEPRFWSNAACGAVASLLVFLPLLRYMRDAPDMFWFRASSRVAEVEQALPASPWHTFAANIRDSLLMFNYRGCSVWVNTVPGDPALSIVVGALFFLGVVVVLRQLFRRGDRRGLYLVLSLVVLVLPSALSVTFPEENPSVVRAGGAIPIAALFAALATNTVSHGLRPYLPPDRRWLITLVPTVLLVSAAYLSYSWIFVTYNHQYRLVAWNASELGQVVRHFIHQEGDLEQAYHISYHRWVDPRLIAINAGDITWRNVVDDLTDLRDHQTQGRPMLYLLHIADQQAIRALRTRFPRGQLVHYQSAVPDRDFLIYYVPVRNPNREEDPRPRAYEQRAHPGGLGSRASWRGADPESVGEAHRTARSAPRTSLLQRRPIGPR